MTMDPHSHLGAGAAGPDGSITARGGGRPDAGSSRGADSVGLDAYAYGLLDPQAGAAGENLRLLGAATLGIEVTVPELARRCGLGNIDPQHGGGAGIGTPGIAAIEACLTATPPPAGATLVTVRPDLDAFGAMALLALRHAGGTPSPVMRARIDHAARADRFDHGPWPGPRPLPGRCDDFAPAGDRDSTLIGVTGAMFDRELTARERVGLAARWLETGAEPAGYRERWTVHAKMLIDGLRDGAITIESMAGNRFALVTSRLPGSLRLGYRLAPVVVAHNPGCPDAESPVPRRVVIAQYALGHVDLRAAGDVLSQLEPGWGGSSTLIGSPQGRPCGLGLETIVDTVTRCLPPVEAGPHRDASCDPGTNPETRGEGSNP